MLAKAQPGDVGRSEDIFWRTFFLQFLLMIPTFKLLEAWDFIWRHWACLHAYLAIADRKRTKNIFFLSLVRSSNRDPCIYVLHAQLHFLPPGSISLLFSALSELESRQLHPLTATMSYPGHTMNLLHQIINCKIS